MTKREVRASCNHMQVTVIVIYIGEPTSQDTKAMWFVARRSDGRHNEKSMQSYAAYRPIMIHITSIYAPSNYCILDPVYL